MAKAQHNALPNGFEFEDYRIEDVLGAGGFGITYRAIELSVNRRVAVKEYLPQGVAMRERDGVSVHPVSDAEEADYLWGLDRFQSEAQTLVQFRHPNIVSMLRFFDANGTAYLVMEYQEGEPLDQILANGKTLGEARLMAIMMPLLDGLDQIHAAGFLHRDIKPANIFVQEGDLPVLIDFGAARQALGERSKSLTAIVTSGYAPVEQYSSQSDQGPWTDIYAFAATIYRAIAGRPPPDATERVLSDGIVPPGEAARGKYSANLLAAVEAGLAVRPEDRTQSIAEWRRILTEGRPAPKKPASRRGTAVAAALVLLALTGAAWWTMRAPEPAGQEPAAADIRGVPQEDARGQAAEAERRAAEEAARTKAKAEAEAKRNAEEDARVKAAAEAKRKAEDEARTRAAAEAKRKAEDEARRKELERKVQEAEQRAREAEQKAAAAAKTKAEREAAQQAALPSAKDNPFFGKTAYFSRLSPEAGKTMRIQLVFRPDGSLDAKCVLESSTGGTEPCVRTIGESGSGLWSYAKNQLCLTAGVIGEGARNCYAIQGAGGQYSASGSGPLDGSFMMR